MQSTEQLAFEWQSMAEVRGCDMPGCLVPARYALTIVTLDVTGAEQRLQVGYSCMAYAQHRAQRLGVAAPAAIMSATIS